MLPSSTVKPLGIRILHLDSKHLRPNTRRNLNRTAKEARRGSVGQRLARRVKGRLGDGVGARVEVELDDVADGGGDAVGFKGKAAIADLDDVDAGDAG